MKKSTRKHEGDINFWQPTSDLMSGLMYVLMLVILLLGLHLMQLPEHHELDPNLGDSYNEYASPTPTPATGTEGEYQYQHDQEEDGGEGGDNTVIYVTINDGGEGDYPKHLNGNYSVISEVGLWPQN